MNFKPCIDLHDGKVKQIVGETLRIDNEGLIENFVSEHSSSYYAKLFQRDNLKGGHVIMLGKGNTDAALEALSAYPQGLQVGGGIQADNAQLYLDHGASHVIVTSYIFRDGKFQKDNLDKILNAVGKERLVIDLSCKEKDGKWFVVSNQWTQFTDFEVNAENVAYLEQFCDEFLIHAVDVEGKQQGFQKELVSALADWVSITTTYAGGVRSFTDLEQFKGLSKEKIDITIGSALDIFGGALSYDEVVQYFKMIE